MKITEDCYWYVDKNDDGEQSMQAMCVNCRERFEKEETEFGWLWEGSKFGYGDYDLSCSLCDEIIYQREEDANKNQN